MPDHDFSSAPELDIFIVPSSLDVNGVSANAPLVAFVEDRGSRARWLASNCAGAFLLGQASLLKDRTVTTYVGRWDDLRERFPEANVVEEHVVVDGNLVSSVGGVTSYDAALTLLGEITNQTLTDAVAEALYYFPGCTGRRARTASRLKTKLGGRMVSLLGRDASTLRTSSARV